MMVYGPQSSKPSCLAESPRLGFQDLRKVAIPLTTRTSVFAGIRKLNIDITGTLQNIALVVEGD